MTEKISGQEEMNAVVVQGEKLSATTATAGREKIRQQVLGLKNEWNMLLSEADSLQKRADGSRILWQAYRKDIEQLKHLLLVKDKWVTADMRLLKDSLEEKREQLQARKVRSLRLQIFLFIFLSLSFVIVYVIPLKVLRRHCLNFQVHTFIDI